MVSVTKIKEEQIQKVEVNEFSVRSSVCINCSKLLISVNFLFPFLWLVLVKLIYLFSRVDNYH